jgi:hypothetical protein
LEANALGFQLGDDLGDIRGYTEVCNKAEEG